MGNEISRETRQKTGLSRDEVYRMVNNQVKEYERNIKQLNVSQSINQSAGTTRQSTGSGYSWETVGQILLENREDYEKKLERKLNIRKATKLQSNQPAETASFEKKTSTQNTEKVSQNSNQPDMYPNLNDVKFDNEELWKMAVRSQSQTTGSPQNEMMYAPNINRSSQPHPSAPPLPTCVGLTQKPTSSKPTPQPRISAPPQPTSAGLTQTPTSSKPTPQPRASAPPLPTSAELTQTAPSPKPTRQFRIRTPAVTSAGLPQTATSSKLTRPNHPPPPPPRSDALLHPPSPQTEDHAYDCKTCGEIFGLMIFQCPQGHSSCLSCKKFREQCGLCKQPIGDKRNITLEKRVRQETFLCKNHAEGCQEILKNLFIDAHLRECQFKDFECPLNSIFDRRRQCCWIGKLSQMTYHFDDVHPSHRVNLNKDFDLCLNAGRSIYLVELSSNIFLVHMKVTTTKIYMTVQMLDTGLNASKWIYRILLYKECEPRKPLVCFNFCESTSVCIDDVFEEEACVVISRSDFVKSEYKSYEFYIENTVQ